MGERVSTDDHVAIADLLGRYCLHIDEGAADDWAGLFTEDAVFEGPANPQPLVGRQVLRDFAAATYASAQGRARHMVANLNCVYGASRDELQARFYNQITVWGEGGRPMALAICDMSFARVGGEWRIRRNRYQLL